MRLCVIQVADIFIFVLLCSLANLQFHCMQCKGEKNEGAGVVRGDIYLCLLFLLFPLSTKP